MLKPVHGIVSAIGADTGTLLNPSPEFAIGPVSLNARDTISGEVRVAIDFRNHDDQGRRKSMGPGPEQYLGVSNGF